MGVSPSSTYELWARLLGYAWEDGPLCFLSGCDVRNGKSHSVATRESSVQGESCMLRMAEKKEGRNVALDGIMDLCITLLHSHPTWEPHVR